jgi:hypothetical protein
MVYDEAGGVSTNQLPFRIFTEQVTVLVFLVTDAKAKIN